MDLDDLYRAPLDQFTALRNALAASLKKAGDKAAADQVRQLVKPSVTAWAVNQVWWTRPDVFTALLEAGAAQRHALVVFSQGGRADVRTAAEARERAVRAALEAAVEVLGSGKGVSPDAAFRLSGTIEALASSGMPEGEAPGRLTRDLQSSGLGALGALASSGAALAMEPSALPGPMSAPSSSSSPSSSSAPSSPAPARPVIVRRSPAPPARTPVRDPDAGAAARAQTAARARVQELEGLHAETARVADQTRAAHARAAAEAEAATAARSRLEAAWQEAREAESQARRRLAEATAAAGEAEMKHARTARELAAARQADGAR